MQAKLLLLNDKRKPTELKLKKLPITLGRGREAGLTVAHPMISRQHCEFYEIENTLCIRDLGSLNGTFVGDIRIDEASLESGDILAVGSVQFRVIIDQASELMPPDLSAEEAEPPIDAEVDDDFSDVEVEFAPADDASEDFSEVVELEDVAAPEKKRPAPKPAPVAASKPKAKKKSPPGSATKEATSAKKPSGKPAGKPSAKPAGKPAAVPAKKAASDTPAQRPQSGKAVKTKRATKTETVSFDTGGEAPPVAPEDDDLNDFLSGLK